MSVNGILTGQQKSYTKAEEDALLATKQNTLTFDDTPTQNSDNPVKSSGIKAVIDNVVNGVTPVALAENLTSDSTQSSADTFIERTTGGTASLSDGDGWIQVVRGSHTHTGYTAGSANAVVTSASHSLSGTIDEEEFLAAVSDTSGTMEFFYTTNWDYDPASYGITITGTPLSGDSIVVTYDTTDVTTVVMTIIPVYHVISAEVDEETFLAQMTSASGYMDFIYTTNWNYDPTAYGITVTGSPISGDQIRVTYVKEVRGTITQSNPQTFKSSGWNLYNHTNGYARVLKYSEVYGFGIAGTYTSLAFSPTISGAQTTVTVTDGKFTINEDGYIFVTGGNNTDTQIWMTWSDWISQANGGTWEAYTESTVDFSSIMSSYFPYGLLEVGSYQDEINFSTGVAINKVARMAYSSANLATVRAMGVDYEYDENYIYYALSAPVSNNISIDNSFDAYDHGLEWFTGTTLAVDTQTIYGRNLKNKLERDVLTISQQDLTDSDITQVKENLKMSYISNENLLDNWYFGNPVNQRGASSYSNISQAYTIDRWAFTYVSSGGGNITFNQGYITISGNGLFFRQRLNTVFANKPYTLTALFLDGTIKTLSGIAPSDSNTYVTETGNPLSFNSTYVRFYLASGVSYNLVAMKLEFGTDQTLVHQEGSTWALNEVPNYQYELYKCMTSTADSTDIYANKSLYPNVPNKNLLDNWYFVGGGSQLGSGIFPINQRRASTGTNSGTIAFDRWSTDSLWRLDSDGVYLEKRSDSSYNASLSQHIETNRIPEGLRTVTLSALWSDGTFWTNSETITYTSGWQCISGAVNSNGCAIRSHSSQWQIAIWNSNTSKKLQAVKLEYGTQQTLCHNTGTASSPVWVLNNLPDYWDEWDKCNRYLQIYYRDSTYSTGRMIDCQFCTESLAGHLMFNFAFPDMVKAPTVSNNSALAVRSILSTANLSDLTFSFPSVTKNLIAIKATGTSYTPGNLYWISTLNTGGTLVLSAEI